MKRWRIMIEIEKLLGAVYIKAKSVKKTSHDTVLADGVSIELPGNIVSVRKVAS